MSDTLALQMLTPGMARIVWALGKMPRRIFGRGVTLAGSAGSDLWFDARLSEALDDGIEQVVILGAGYDSRAWRCARDGVRFFELDHSASQLAKKEAAPGPGPTYVEADLSLHSAAEALATGGLDATKPAMVLVESVTMYLTEAVVRRQFSELARAMPSGSLLAVNFLPATPPQTVQTKRQLRLQRAARVGTGESLRFGLDPDDAAALIEASGWSVRERTTFRDAARRYVGSQAGLPVEAIDERKSLLLATL